VAISFLFLIAFIIVLNSLTSITLKAVISIILFFRLVYLSISI